MATQVINNYLYLMSMSDLASLQDISINIDPKRFNACIKDAQDLDLSLYMGDAFYYDFINYFSLTGFLTAGISNPATTAADGTYQNVALTGGNGNGAFANIIVLGSKVTSIIQTEPGIGYNAGDSLSCTSTPGASFTILSLCGVFQPGTPQLIQDLYNGCIYNDLSGNPVYYQGMIPALAYWAFARFIEVDQVRYTTTGPVQKNHDASEPASMKQINALVEMQRSKANAFVNKMEKFLRIHKQDFPLWRMSQQNKNSRQPGARIRAIDRQKYNRAAYGYYPGDDILGNYPY